MNRPTCSTCLFWYEIPGSDGKSGHCRPAPPGLCTRETTAADYSCGGWAPDRRNNVDPEVAALREELDQLRGVGELLEVVRAELAEQKFLNRSLAERAAALIKSWPPTGVEPATSRKRDEEMAVAVLALTPEGL